MTYIGNVNSNKQKYLYFRTEATDASAITIAHAAVFPASSLMGIAHTARTTITLYFKSMLRGVPSGNEADALANFDNNDNVVLNVTTETQFTTIKAILEAINNPNLPSVLVIANDDSGGTEYLSGSTITSCGAITASIAYAN